MKASIKIPEPVQEEIIITLTKEEAEELVRLIGNTSTAERIKFFKDVGGEVPKMFNTGGLGRDDIVGYLWEVLCDFI